MKNVRLLSLVALSLLAASTGACSSCSSDESASTEGGVGVSSTKSAGTDASGSGGGLAVGVGGTSGTGSGSGGGACEPPDLLIVLDRTMSMARRPDGSAPPDTAAGHAESKWYLAVNAVEQVTAPPADTGLRFGLELFPRDPGGDVCITLSQRIQGISATNPQCEQGEVVVSPGPEQSAPIAAAIDPETTLLCISTPIGAALVTATAELAKIADPIRDQYVLFVTDGGDTCSPDPGPEPVNEVQMLAAAGIKTYVVGFGSQGGGDGVNVPLLNQLACAGMTAKDFANACQMGANGYEPTKPTGPPLFYDAADGASLSAGLKAIAGEVCCDCVPS